MRACEKQGVLMVFFGETPSVHPVSHTLNTRGCDPVGSPTQVILQFAQTHHIDLIIMRSHGDTGFKRWMLGSVALELVRHSLVPILVLRNSYSLGRTSAMHPFHVLVALDGSPIAEDALLPAAQLCAALAAPESGAIHFSQVVYHFMAY
jgi:hypothetical protein